MLSDYNVVIVLATGSCIFCLAVWLCYLKMYCKGNQAGRRGGQCFRSTDSRYSTAQQEENGVYNISSRVQGQPHQFPDAYLSVEHISISNELNKPPKYDDAPPSYEEAIKIAMAQSNSLQTFQAEQPNNTRPQPQSSTSTTTTTVVVPAVPSQTTE